MARIPYRIRIPALVSVIALLLVVLLLGCGSAPRAPEDLPPEEETRKEKEERTYEEIRSAINAGKPGKALAAFEKSYPTPPEDLEGKLLYASLLISSKKLEQADRILTGILSDQPQHPEALYNKALIRGMQGRTEKQKKLLQRTVSSEGEFADAHASLGEIYLQEENVEKATEQFEKSLAIEDNFAARMGYGHLLLREGKFEKALEQLNRAIELNPRFSLAYADRGRARAKLDELDAALEDYTRAIEIAPDNYWNRIDRGKLRLETGELEKASRDFTRAAELKPDFFLAHVYLAGIYNDQNKPERALEKYERVLELNSDYYPVYKPAAVNHYLQENYRRAAELFQREFERYKEKQRDHGLALMSALCHMQGGDKAAAQKLLDRTMKKAGKDSIFYHLARMYSNNNYTDYLMNELKKVEEKPKEIRALFYLASYYDMHDHSNLARKYYMEVTDANLFGIYETRIAEHKMEGAIEEQQQN